MGNKMLLADWSQYCCYMQIERILKKIDENKTLKKGAKFVFRSVWFFVRFKTAAGFPKEKNTSFEKSNGHPERIVPKTVAKLNEDWKTIGSY